MRGVVITMEKDRSAAGEEAMEFFQSPVEKLGIRVFRTPKITKAELLLPIPRAKLMDFLCEEGRIQVDKVDTTSWQAFRSLQAIPQVNSGFHGLQPTAPSCEQSTTLSPCHRWCEPSGHLLNRLRRNSKSLSHLYKVRASVVAPVVHRFPLPVVSLRR